jgi:hypothetical protein
MKRIGAAFCVSLLNVRAASGWERCIMDHPFTDQRIRMKKLALLAMLVAAPAPIEELGPCDRPRGKAAVLTGVPSVISYATSASFGRLGLQPWITRRPLQALLRAGR